MTDWRALCEELAEALDHNRQCLLDDRRLTHPLADKARAALAEPVAEGPTDEELLEIRDGAYCPGIDEVNDEDDSSWQYTSDYIRWLDENGTPQEQEAYEAKRLRAVFEAGRRWSCPASAPVPVAERLPEPNSKVIAHYFNDHGKGRTICAIWVPAKSRSDEADFADRDFTEYDEEDDKFYWPEGWYEAIENWDDLGWVKVDEGEVAYWQPLPKWPALPLPAGEVQP